MHGLHEEPTHTGASGIGVDDDVVYMAGSAQACGHHTAKVATAGVRTAVELLT